MAKIYALAQQKGGVGKTTTAINLGAALVERGRQVLLIDVDPLSLKETVYDVLRNARFDISHVIRRTDAGCDLAPANIDLAASDIELVSEPGRERILKEKLSPVLDEAVRYLLMPLLSSQP